MNEFDNENRILEYMRDVPTTKVCILYDDDISKTIYESLLNNKDNWIDNSAKSALPPDYINITNSIMMEVMRVNDTNSDTNREETRMQHELSDSGILKMFPKNVKICCTPNVHTQSYEEYVCSFIQTVKKHNSKIGKYKKNHPDIEKIIFLICDESEAYFELGELTNKGFRGNVHQWFFDSKFMNVLKNTSVDIVIWFTPYKVLERDGIDFPEVVVINPRLIDKSKLIEYDKERMFDATRVQRVI